MMSTNAGKVNESECSSASTLRSMVGLSEIDPNSFSRPDECIVTHLHLDIDVDFVDRKLRGSVKIGIRKVTPSAQRLVSVMRCYTRSC